MIVRLELDSRPSIQEGFKDFHDYQNLIKEEDEVCAGVMSHVFEHMVPAHVRVESGRMASEHRRMTP